MIVLDRECWNISLSLTLLPSNPFIPSCENKTKEISVKMEPGSPDGELLHK